MAELPAIRGVEGASDDPNQHPSGSVDVSDIEGSFAPNTRIAYASDWRLWKAWCADAGRAAFPPDPADVAEWTKYRAARGARLSSLRRAISAIATACRLADVEFDRRSPALYYAFRRLSREHGTAATNARAELLTDDLVAMLPAGASLRAVRDRALLLIGYAGGFRRSELAGLEVPDLAWRRDGATIALRKSKTDQAGAGQLVAIVYGAKDKTCPLRALKAWLALSQICDGPLFRRLTSSGQLTRQPIQADTVYRLVKAYAEAAGIDNSRLGAHSLRVGHVTQALQNGADPVKAKDQLRHKKLDTTLGYNRGGASLFLNNTSGKLGL